MAPPRRPPTPGRPAASAAGPAGVAGLASAAAPLRLRLDLPEPYDLGWVLGFLADRAAPAIERVAAGGLTRVVRLAGAPVVLTMRFPAPAPPTGPPSGALSGAFRRRLYVEAAPAEPGGAPDAALPAAAVRRLVRRMLDLTTDLAPFLAMARRDPLLAPLVARHPGLRLPQLPDPFEGAVRAIIGQQVSVAAARTVVDRLIRALGEPLAGTALYAFPDPATLAAAPPERLTALGLTRAKAAALIAAGAAAAGGVLSAERLRGMAPEDVQAALVALPGIGAWTASYIRMRALADHDAFPAADLGVVKAVAALAPRTAPAAIATLALRWQPFRAYAAIHLWRSLAPDT